MVRLLWNNEQDGVAISEDLIAALKRCMEKTLEYESFLSDAEISLTFTDNSGIQAYNLSARGIDRPTDVLSFPLFNFEPATGHKICDADLFDGAAVLGDIVISAEKAAQQAEEFGHSLMRELAFLTVHSMLHLLGYDHERSQEEETLMFQKQDEILNLLGITR